MKRKIYLCLLILSLTLVKTYAQLDPNFFNLNVVNPAFVGSKENFSLSVDYGLSFVDLEFIKINRIEGAPQSFVGSVYTPISNKIGVGISYVDFKSGSVKEKVLNADVSYKFNLTIDSNLTIGLKTGYTTTNLGFIELSGEFGEPIGVISPKETTLNLGFGTYYYNDNFSLGLSVPNFIPKNPLDDTDETAIKPAINIVLSSTYKTNLSETIEFSPGALVIFNADIDTQYYISANFNFKKVIGVGLNYQKDVFGILLTSPKIAKIFRVGLNIGFVNTKFETPFNNNIEFFGNYDFNPIFPNNKADNLPTN